MVPSLDYGPLERVRCAMTRAPLAVLLLAFGACGDDASAPIELSAELVGALAATADTYWHEAHANGLAVTVVHDGASWTSARGVADVASERAVVAHDRFRVGSITKTFTAAVILQLADEGALELDDPIDQWVPGFDLGPDVTIRRALNHTSGVFSYTDDFAFLARITEPVAPRDIVAFALEHAPGTDWKYSNTNFVLLGLVIEAADQRPHHASLRARLIDPLGLSDTFVESGEPVSGLVTGYVNYVDFGEAEFDPSWGYGTGSIVSTGADLCRWADALFRGDVLPPALLELMTTETVAGDAPTEYGLGSYLYMRDGRAVVGHTGSTMGFNAELFIEPPTGDCVAILTNDFQGAPGLLAERLWALLPD